MANSKSVIACKSYVECLFRQPSTEQKKKLRPFITVSRQAGAGGITIGNLVGEYLREHDERLQCECPWTVFDKNLLQKVVEDHHLSEKLIEYMAEDKVSEIADTLEDLLGLHPARWILVRKTTETILRLAEIGHVVLVGRGAHVITAKLAGGFHVRLIGSLKKRQQHVAEFYGLGRKEALDFIRKEDRDRKNYLKKYFGKDIEDPLSYDLIINADRLSYEQAAKIIGDAVLDRPAYFVQP